MSAETNAARAAEIEALAAEMKAEMDRREAMYPLAGSIVNSDAVNDKIDLFRAIVSALVQVQREAEARVRSQWAAEQAMILSGLEEQSKSLAEAHDLIKRLKAKIDDLTARADTPSPVAQPAKEEI